MTRPTLPPSTRELARLRPAEVTPRPVVNHRAPARRQPTADQHVETLIGDQRAINLEIRRQGGRLVDTGVQRLIQSGPHAGKLELRVIVQDNKKASRWVKVCAGIGLVLAPTTALVLAVWWLLSTLTLASLGGFVVVVLIVLGIIVRVGRGGNGRARGVFVQVNTSVHVR